jgi:D-3-phosphoglycerate dehydrogenase
MSNKKILITDDVHPLLVEELKGAGFQVDYEPRLSLEQVRKRIAPYTGVIINSKIIVDRDMLDRASQLRFIGRLGSGLDIIDLDYSAEKEVAVISAPEGNRNAVAEHALGMLLSLANNLCRADAQVRNKIWDREGNRGFELSGLTIGILGCGNTGFAFVNKLSGLGVKVLTYDKYKNYYLEPSCYAKEVDLNTLQQEADIISLHLPLTSETHHLINRQFLEKCRDGLILINTSRGAVVSTPELLDALEEGKVAAAALDVFENEKPTTFSEEEEKVYQRLYQNKNVMLSPHVAGWTVESKRRIAEIVLQRILALET